MYIKIKNIDTENYFIDPTKIEAIRVEENGNYILQMTYGDWYKCRESDNWDLFGYVNHNTYCTNPTEPNQHTTNN